MIGVSTILALILIGVLVWLLFYVVPLPQVVRNVIAVILAIGILLWILSLMGVVAF